MTGEGGAPAKPQRSNLQQRVISALVLIVLVLALTWLGGVWYRLLAVAIGGAIFYEWTKMALGEAKPSHRLFASAVLAIFLAAVILGLPVWQLLVILAIGVVTAFIHGRITHAGSWLAGGAAYAGLSALSLAVLRGHDMAGLVATVFLFAVVWSTDILAYFVGKALGGPKLAPRISPGKTWSGAIGGALFGTIAGLIAARLGGATAGFSVMLLVSLALSVVSQIGDLYESSLKRRFGAKDSSQLIPGHGGVMDRVDGLVAAAFALFVTGAAIAGLDSPAQAFF